MNRPTDRRLARRKFLQGAVAAGAVAATAGLRPLRSYGAAGAAVPAFEAGEGVVDTTPPLKIELGGFHRPPGQERRVEGIRQKTAARALMLRVGDDRAAIVSLDIAAVPTDFSTRVARKVAEAVQIPAENVRICATHTHSMPSFYPLRQWGAVPTDYMADVEGKIVEAVKLAKQDLAPAELSVGTARAVGANFNRTTKEWKTDEHFTKEATDDGRWLDTLLHVMRFERAAAAGGQKRPDLLWYHFSAHPVCYTDTQAGPDWPGLVADAAQKDYGVTPSFIQGHAGDVNPGDGDPWIGDPAKTSTRAYAALRAAIESAKRIKVDALRVHTAECQIPIDRERLANELERYRKDPAACASGEWVDAGFAKDWYEDASKWKLDRTHLTAPVSTLRLGELGWLFHPSELFSYYGLSLRHSAPTPHTLIAGYTDGIIGYLTDPAAYPGAYEAVVVPKILDLPPFTPTAAREFTGQAMELAKKHLA